MPVRGFVQAMHACQLLLMHACERVACVLRTALTDAGNRGLIHVDAATNRLELIKILAAASETQTDMRDCLCRGYQRTAQLQLNIAQ